MQILWRLKNAYVHDILAEMPEPKPPYNTVSSIVRKLESEAMVSYEAFGKTHRYFAVLTKSQYRRFLFKRMISEYFSGSPRRLLSHFVKEEDTDPEELKRIIDHLKEEE